MYIMLCVYVCMCVYVCVCSEGHMQLIVYQVAGIESLCVRVIILVCSV